MNIIKELVIIIVGIVISLFLGRVLHIPCWVIVAAALVINYFCKSNNSDENK